MKTKLTLLAALLLPVIAIATSPLYTRNGSSTSDNQLIFEMTVQNAQIQNYDTFTLGSSAGVMDVYACGNNCGTAANWLATPVALLNLSGTDLTTAVTETTAGGHYGFRGAWQGIRVYQKGATAVENAYFNAYTLGN